MTLKECLGRHEKPVPLNEVDMAQNDFCLELCLKFSLIQISVLPLVHLYCMQKYEQEGCPGMLVSILVFCLILF